MPELPEMETIASDLRESVLGAIILDARVMVPRLRNQIHPDSRARMTGGIIRRVDRKAKYIVIELDNSWNVLLHLGMSGSLLIVPEPYVTHKHDHVVIMLNNDRTIVFNDPRRFGFFAVESHEWIENKLKDLGCEPYELSRERLRKILRGQRTMKSIMTDSSLITGIGNIYASEILFHAKIDPRRAAASITCSEIDKLLVSIKEILAKAVTLRGSTIKDYRDSNGESGGYQKEFLAYDRANKPCKSCGDMIKKIKQQGRSTYVCDSCQA